MATDPILTIWLSSRANFTWAFGGSKNSSSVLKYKSYGSNRVLNAKEKVSNAKESRSLMVGRG